MFKYIKKQELSAQDKQTVINTKINLSTTGSILHDFYVMLDYVVTNQPSVTKNHLFRSTELRELNARMKRPLQHNLKRAIQKSYPNLNGLYLILRASGLTFVIMHNRTAKLVVDESALNRWHGLNPTEQYFTLLESWLVRSTNEIIGGDRSRGLPLNNCLELFARFSWESDTLTRDGDAYFMKYTPEWHNLALLEMFGMITIKVGNVAAGKGWQPAEVSPTSFGKVMFNLLHDEALRDNDLLFGFDDVSTVPYGKLQPLFQPYFPAWQRNLELKETAVFRDGLYIFKASLPGRIWRRIVVPAQYSLEFLGSAILNAFDFDNDHLHRFIYRDRIGGKTVVNHPYMRELPFTSDIRVGDVPLPVGASMLFHFDFGDDWHFEITLERIDSDTSVNKSTILDSHGDAPLQYPSYDDEW